MCGSRHGLWRIWPAITAGGGGRVVSVSSSGHRRSGIRWDDVQMTRGYDKWDAYMMLSQCGKVRLGNFVDPKYTMGAMISKHYLAQN